VSIQHCGVMVNHTPHTYMTGWGAASGHGHAVDCPGTQHRQEIAFVPVQRHAHPGVNIYEDDDFTRCARAAFRGLLKLPSDGAAHIFVGANRYDTDDTCVLHLWTADGESFDVTWPKTARVSDDVSGG
jgi:hypothetical protein